MLFSLLPTNLIDLVYFPCILFNQWLKYFMSPTYGLCGKQESLSSIHIVVQSPQVQFIKTAPERPVFTCKMEIR